MKQTIASIAELLCQAHATLLHDLAKLEEAVEPTSEESLAQLLSRLAAARSHLARHFHFEERNGYMDAVRKREPRLERTIQLLAEEHGELMASLETLIEQAKAATSLDDPCRDKVRKWVGRVRRHEVREGELVQDAFNQDIAAED
jgi:hemerythrin-like domain-containing protein